MAFGSTPRAPRDHLVTFVDGDDELIASLVSFAVVAWRRQEPVVVIATQEHRDQLDVALHDAGWQPHRLRESGRLVTVDASDLLQSILVDGRLDAQLFRSKALALLDGVRPGRVSIFGEMVRLLWERGDVVTALALEECWNALAEERSFTLLCGYAHTLLDPTSLADVGRVCALHSDVLPPTRS